MNKKYFDKEYSTQFLQETDALTKAGIKYTFVKTDEHDVRIYKYTKNEKLFKTLMEFYKNR
jgi:hypothetical protein